MTQTDQAPTPIDPGTAAVGRYRWLEKLERYR